MKKWLAIILAVGAFASFAEARAPNIVFIFIDDLGYGDIGPFGNTVNQTPHLDRMAAEGLILTQFYVSNTACTPSRSALMTGTYAQRIGMDGSVVFPGEERGLHPDEITIADLLKTKGYATGCFGKWHLGDQPEFLPLKQGFDEYFGIPYSNDMWPGNQRGNRITNGGPYTPLPVIRQNKPVAYVSDGADQSLLCEAVTDEAVKFIKSHRDEPFLLYLPHAYVHSPRYARPEILAKAGGDVNRANVEEVDASVGRVLDTLRELKLDKNTLVVFTSDNGGAGGMSMGPLRGNKGGPKYEGHMREPTITWWPGTIPAGAKTDEIVTTTDMLPSLARLAGADVPTDRKIDGKDALDVLLGKPGAKSPHEILYYEIDAVRRGKWKLIRIGKAKSLKSELYDLDADVGEKNNLAKQQPELVKELGALLDAHAENLAAEVRPAGFVKNAKPIISEPGDLPRLRDYMGKPNVVAANDSGMPKPASGGVKKKGGKASAKAPEQLDVEPARYTPAPDDILIADFEGGDYGDWKVAGKAFGKRPAVAGVSPRNKVTGHLGKGLVNTFLEGDKTTGALTSAPFTIERERINFLIGGGRHAGKTCLKLVIDGKPARTAVGSARKDSRTREVLDWQSWDVSEYAGKQAILEIVDAHSGSWGHINVDHIFQSNRAMQPRPAPAKAGPAPVARQPAPRVFPSPEELDKQRREYAARPEAYAETYRPRFHFSALTGWLNDPNGLVYHDGEYHLYFQAWPPDVRAGGKIWSHAVSANLVHWEQVEHAILNDGDRMIWSGSAVVDHRNSAGLNQGDQKALIAFYTLTNPFVQCLAYSHDRGRTFTKLAEPVIGEINKGTRDPKVFWSAKHGKWIMILHGAPYLLFESTDLKHWNRLGEIPLKGLSECPELFELPVDGDPKNTRWVVWGGRGAYCLGRFDGKNFTPDFEDLIESELASRGKGSYAGQTFNDAPNGRRIMIAWLKWKPGRSPSESFKDVYPGMPFTQQMTVPREVSLRSTADGIRLFLNPVEELKTLRGKATSWRNLKLNANDNPLSALRGDAFEIECELARGDAKQVVLDIRGIPLTVNPDAWKLTFQNHSLELPGAGETLALRILIDVNSIEIYAEDGRYALSTCFLADPKNLSLALTADAGGATATALTVWPLNSIWNQSRKAR